MRKGVATIATVATLRFLLAAATVANVAIVAGGSQILRPQLVALALGAHVASVREVFQGERLRQRRREYEAYLRRFCAP